MRKLVTSRRVQGRACQRGFQLPIEPLLSALGGSRAEKRLLPVCVLAIASACSPSLESHLTTVRALSHAQRLPSLRDGEVDPTTAAHARQLLERPLDADAAVRIALVNNRELRAQLRELGVPASQLVTAGLIANPTLEFELLPERDSRYELRAEYDLTSLIMAPLRYGAARDNLEAARVRAAAEVIQLGYETRTRFSTSQSLRPTAASSPRLRSTLRRRCSCR